MASITIAILGIALGLLGQVILVVWGAAKLKAAVEAGAEAIKDLRSTLKDISNTVQDHGEAIAALRALVERNGR